MQAAGADDDSGLVHGDRAGGPALGVRADTASPLREAVKPDTGSHDIGAEPVSYGGKEEHVQLSAVN